MTGRVLAADVGGTNIRTAVVDADGTIHARHREQAELSRLHAGSADEAAARVLQTIEASFRPLLAEAPDVTAVGIGFPGFFRGDSGVLVASPNLPGLADFPLAEQMQARLGLPVHVHNDALAACLGEFHFGAGRGLTHLMHLTLGTGVGGGAIIDGTPYAGEGGMSMEIGHLRVVDPAQPDARPCGCGGKGCLETYASASAVAARYAKAIGRDWVTPVEIHERADKGEALARQVFAEAGAYLGQAIAEAAKLLDIRTVTVGGGLSQAWEWLHPPLVQSMETRVIPPHRGQIRVLRSTLGDDAGLLGAAALALEQTES
jgi:glucokinase